MGNVDQGKGTVEGDTWIWEGESKTGGNVMKSRYSMKTSPSSYSFTWEMSLDGGPWTKIMEGTASKVN